MSSQIIFPAETLFKGTPFPQGERYTLRYDPARGFDSTTLFKGFNQNQLNQLFQSFVQQGIACELVLYEDVGEVNVQDATNEYTIDSWEIVGSDEATDGLSSPVIAAVLSGSPDNYANLRAELENNDKASLLNSNLIASGFNMAQAAQVTQFYVLQQAGSTNYRTAQYVLRHKTNVSNRWSQNVSDVGVETIYTPAQILSETTDSGLWIYPLPDRLQFKIGAIPVQGPTNNYLWGWLKSPSTESNVANNRVDITTDYTLALWSVQPNGYYAAFNGVYGTTPYY